MTISTSFRNKVCGKKCRNYSSPSSSIPSHKQIAISGIKTGNCMVCSWWGLFCLAFSGIFCSVYYQQFFLSRIYCPVRFVQVYFDWYILSGILCMDIFVQVMWYTLVISIQYIHFGYINPLYVYFLPNKLIENSQCAFACFRLSFAHSKCVAHISTVNISY